MHERAGREIEQLVDLMARLPGLGPRSARRAVLQMIKKRGQLLEPLAKSIAEVSATARECMSCGNISGLEICAICNDPERQNGEMCIVEDVSDLWAMERTSLFKGTYHVLGGVLSALDGVGPDVLRIPRLVERVHEHNISEVILALNATIDGQTTAHYIVDQIEGSNVRITSLAQGVPIGGELDYLDDGTISAALKARKAF